MNLTGLIGNEQIKKILMKPFHAYIIEGETGSGRHTLLRLMTAGYVCTAPQDARPCMKCAQCRKFLSGNHPDVTYIQPDIKTEGLRRVLSDVAYMPNEAEKRCFIVDGADKLSIQNQNILLKTLEEPPSYAVFMLLCSSKEGLLETVRSRCMCLTLSPVGQNEIKRVLSRPDYSAYGEDKKKEAEAFCDGYIGKAISILESGSADVYSKCGEFAGALVRGDCAAMLDICSFKKRDEFLTFVRDTERYFGLALRAVCLPGAAPFDPEVARLGRKKLTALVTRLGQIARAAEMNVNVSLWSVRMVRDCAECASDKKKT